jgi:hypothetical protein
MSISVQINAAATTAASSVSATGPMPMDISLVQSAFQLGDDDAIKNAVAAYSKQQPDNVFFNDPTDWPGKADYATFGWTPVTASAVPGTPIYSVATEKPAIIASTTFENTSEETGTFNCGVTQTVTTTITDSWSDTTTVGADQSISYGISFLGVGGSGTTSFNYSQAWETGGSQSEALALGMSEGVEVTLDPGESVVAALSVSTGTMTITIPYTITLSGRIFSNYRHKYKGHHFYGYDVNAVLQAANLPTSVTITQTYTVDFYCDSTITISTPSGTVVAIFSQAERPGIANAA